MTSAGEARKPDPIGGPSSRRGHMARDEGSLQDEDGRLLSVIDSQGHLCGFFTLAQIRKLPERCEVGRLSATVKSQIDSRRRVALLKASQESPGISTHQRLRIANEIGFIRQHSERASEPIARGAVPALVGDAKNRPTPRRAPKTPSRKEAALEPGPDYRYVTRDEAGLYLGIHTFDEVRAICPTASWIGPAICVPGRVDPDELASLLDERDGRPDVAASDRLLLSARKALERERNAARNGTDPHSSLTSLLPRKVLHKSNRPVCAVPLTTVEAVFGRGWFLVDDSTVQLVTTFDENKIALMGADAQRGYEATSPMAGEGASAAAPTAGREAGVGPRPNEAQSARQAARKDDGPDTEPYVARDAMGLYLGVHKLRWARSRQDGTLVDAGVIVLPEALPTRNAASFVGRARGKALRHFSGNLQEAIRRSEAFMSNVPKRASEEFWSRQDARPVEVHDLDGRDMGPLTPPQLRKLVGNGWFLVSSVEAQLTAPVDDDARERIREAAAQTQAAIDARSAAAGNAWEAAVRAGAAQESADSRASRSANPSRDESAHEDAAPAFMRVMTDLGMDEAHARTIYDQVTLAARHGFLSRLTEMMRKAFPTEPVRLPSGRELYNYHIVNALARRKGQRLTREDRDFVLLALDDSLTESERAEEEERQAAEEYLAQATQHKHVVARWVESTLHDPGADVTSRELAEVFELRQGVVLVMPDDSLYRSVLSTEMTDASYASAIPFLPFSHFIVHMPGIAGIYGFGVVRESGGFGARLIAIPEGERTARDAGSLVPFFERVLFFICTGRGFPSNRREYFDQPSSRTTRRTTEDTRPVGTRDRGKTSAGRDVVRGRSFDVGMKVVFLSEDPSFRHTSASGVDIRPHAVAGTTYVMSNGTEVVRRPYWNHGSGSKRNALPPEIVERNIRYKDEPR